MHKKIAFFLGTFEDWGGASRALLNFVRGIDRNRFRPLVVLTREGNLSKKLTMEGIDWIIWEKHDRSKNLFSYAFHILCAYRMLKAQGIDLVHLNFGAIGWKPAEILAARLAGIPLINHLHITTQDPSPYLRYSTAIVAVSKYVATHTNTFGVPTHAIHNVSNLERFAHGTDIRGELGYDNSDVLVVYMGQMIREKGIEMLIDAFKNVPDQCAKLLLAGGIRETKGAYTQEDVEELVGREPRIRYLGFRTDAENIYATADIMTMPSQWEEPCAMILFESAAAGKPLVATATGGTPEVLRHGETGFLVDRHDIDGLTRCLTQLVDDPELRKKMGRQAAAVAQSTYAHDPIQQMEKLYDSLL